jgi:hypothetical protein
MTGMSSLPRDPIEVAEELFGPKVAEELRRRKRESPPTRVELDPATGRRIYSRGDE